MNDGRIQEVLAKATDALERSRHFRSGSKAYQDFLAKEAAETAAKEERELALQKKAEANQNIHQVRLRDALAEQAVQGGQPPSHPATKPKKILKKKKQPTGIPPLAQLQPLPPKKQPKRGPSASSTTCDFVMQPPGQHAFRVSSAQGLAYANFRNNAYTVPKLRDLMEPPSLFSYRSASALLLNPTKDRLSRLATLGLQTTTPLSLSSSETSLYAEDANAKNAKPNKKSSSTESIGQLGKKYETFEKPKDGRRVVSSPTTSDNESLASSTWTSLAPEPVVPANRKKPVETLPIFPALNEALADIIDNLKMLSGESSAEGLPNDHYIKKDENFEHLALLRLQKEPVPQISPNRKFPPGITPKRRTRATLHIGYPYFTKDGDLADAHNSSDTKLYPSPGFNNDYNMTQVMDVDVSRISKKKQAKDAKSKMSVISNDH